jgi:hypothetical protein
MLRIFVSTMGLVLLLGIAGCGDPNAGALFAEIQYATRCELTLGCSGVEDHDICGFNSSDPCDMAEGTPEASLSCSATEAEGTRSLRFSASQGGGFSVSVSGLVVPTNGGSAMGGSCRVTVREGANTYEGSCGGSAPSEAQPCQITDVTFYDDMGNPTFEADLFCQFLANQANPALQIEVTARGAGGPAFGGTPPMSICATASPSPPACTPARIRFANCDGLTCTPETCATP